ncbi:MAG: extracellular solute-binding protein family 1 [Anaerocolumna sp.]|nr:extracellular solute-binding protein family 1 [Anaerocolumna sp.]
MKRIISKLLVVCMLFVMVFSVTGCGKDDTVDIPKETETETDTPKAEPTAEPTEEPTEASTVLKVTYSGTPEIHEREYLMNSFFSAFEEANNCTVEVDFVAQADAIKKIESEQSTGNIVSDVIYADTANMAPYVNGGWMEDISGIVEATGSTYTKMFDASTNRGAERFFVPMSFDVYITAANVKALAYLPAGLTQEDVVKGITWEQYADWAVAIAEGEGEGKVMMPANMTGSQLLYPMGGMSLAYGGGFPEFTSDGFKQVLGIIAKIAAADGFYAEQDQYTAPTEPLNSGDVWLTFAHMAPVGASYNAAPNNFVIGAAPKGSTGAGSTSGAWCYGIQKGAPHRDLADKFIEYVADPEVNYEFCSNYGGSLSPISEVADFLESSDVVMRAGIEMLETTTITGVPATEYTDWNAVKLLYGDIFNNILENKSVPTDEFLTERQGKLDSLKIAQ